jgi:hypothetical protein
MVKNEFDLKGFFLFPRNLQVLKYIFRQKCFETFFMKFTISVL